MKRWMFVGIASAYASFLFYLSSLSSPPDPTPTLIKFYYVLKNIGMGFLAYPFWFVYLYPDKFCHMVLYVGFGLTLYSALRYFVKYPTFLTLAIGTVYGASDEFHQLFVPHRTASLWDLLADVFGLMLSQILIYAVGRRLA